MLEKLVSNSSSVRGMSLRKLTSLGSNLASITDLKRIETAHSLCCDFGGYKSFTTRWSSSRVQVWVQVWAPAGRLAISPKAVREDNLNRRFRGQNQRPSSWGSPPALLVLVGLASTNTGRFRVCSSRWWQRQAGLRKTCYHSCDTDSAQQSKRFSILGSNESLFFLSEMKVSMESARSCCRPNPRPLLCSIFLSVIGPWVNLWHGNKTACSKSNPVQSSRFKLTTCLRKGRLLRFELNSAATSDRGAQKMIKIFFPTKIPFFSTSI